MNAVWAGDPLAFTGAPEGYYVPYVEIDCNWDYLIESFYKDVLTSEKPETGTSDATFGSSDEEETCSNSEIGLDNGLEPIADPYAVYGASGRLYDSCPEFQSYEESRCAETEDVHETALADNETFTDFDFDTGLPVNQYKQESRSVETKHLEGKTTPVKHNTSFDCDNRLDDEPFASYTPPKVLYKPYRQFEYEQESRSVETKNLEGETTSVEYKTSFDCDNRLDVEPFAIYTPPKVLYKPYREFEYKQIPRKTGSTKRKRTDDGDEVTERKYLRTNGCFV
ncbi:hypothetical protein ScPMuIL_014636 [Solemya velum]